MRQLKIMAQAGNSGCVAAQSLLRAHSAITCSARIRVSSKSTPLSRGQSDQDLERAEGSGRIVVSGTECGTRVKDLFQRSPLRILFPSTGAGAVKEAVFLNTAGGIAGGDRLECDVAALSNASIAVTSQAAEKVYRALNTPARIATRLKACEDAKLAWLPQETILFNGGQLSRTTEIEISNGAELLALEWLVLGRGAHGEEITGGQIADSWRVKKDGRLIWADSFRATDQTFQHLHRKALLSDCKAFGTLVYFGSHLDARLEFLRNLAPARGCCCSMTSMSGLIIARFAARTSFELRRALQGFLQQFGRELGGHPFGMPKMWSC